MSYILTQIFVYSLAISTEDDDDEDEEEGGGGRRGVDLQVMKV